MPPDLNRLNPSDRHWISQIPRDWLRRGQPRWLAGQPRNVRAVRASFVLGLAGTMSGWLGWIVMAHCGTFLNSLLCGALGADPILVTWISPGITFGLLVLIPLSRWHGRHCWFSAAASIVSLVAWATAVGVYCEIDPIGYFSRHEPHHVMLAGGAAGVTGSLIIALWMSPPWKRWQSMSCGTTVLAGCLAGLTFGWLGGACPPPDFPTHPAPAAVVAQSIYQSFVFSMFHSLVAITLGLPLWPNINTGPRFSMEHAL